MPDELVTIGVVVFAMVLLAVFGLLGDERPPGPPTSDRERAVRWLYERLFFAILLGAMVVDQKHPERRSR